MKLHVFIVIDNIQKYFGLNLISAILDNYQKIMLQLFVDKSIIL